MNLECMWNKTVMEYFRVPSLHFLGGIEKNHENIYQLTRCWAGIRTGYLLDANQTLYRYAYPLGMTTLLLLLFEL